MNRRARLRRGQCPVRHTFCFAWATAAPAVPPRRNKPPDVMQLCLVRRHAAHLVLRRHLQRVTHKHGGALHQLLIQQALLLGRHGAPGEVDARAVAGRGHVEASTGPLLRWHIGHAQGKPVGVLWRLHKAYKQRRARHNGELAAERRRGKKRRGGGGGTISAGTRQRGGAAATAHIPRQHTWRMFSMVSGKSRTGPRAYSRSWCAPTFSDTALLSSAATASSVPRLQNRLRAA